MKKNLFIRLSFIVAVIANFAFIAPSDAEEKAAVGRKSAPAKGQKAATTEKKTPDAPLVIPNPLPTDPVENAKIAKKILEKATGKEVNKTIISEKQFEDGTTIKSYSKITPDGIYLYRSETIRKLENGKECKENISIRNGSGKYYILGNIAIKDEYSKVSREDVGDNKLPEKSIFTYSIKESSYKGKTCYEITEKEDSLALEGNDIAITVYVIDKCINIVLSTRYFDKNGKLVVETDFDSVKTSVQVEDNLFDIPDNSIIFNAKTQNEFIEMMTIARDKLLIETNMNPPIIPLLKQHYKKKYGTNDMLEILNKIKKGENKE